MTEAVYCCFTMDCERVAAESPTGGPESWELSERAIEGYVERVVEAGFAVTLFIVPNCAARHARLFRSLQGDRVELGMHFHPQSFGDNRYTEYLAAYPAEMQFELISRGLEVWSDSLGFEPTSFRPGNLSANDSTYQVAHSLGFRQGSFSSPERTVLTWRSCWQSACRYAHHAHPAFRLIPGDLDFLEVPITGDPSRRLWQGTSPMEYRIEFGRAEDHRTTLDRALAEQRAVPFKTILAITHNTFDYRDESDERTQSLLGSLRALRETAARYGLAPTGATLTRIHALFDGRNADG